MSTLETAARGDAGGYGMGDAPQPSGSLTVALLQMAAQGRKEEGSKGGSVTSAVTLRPRASTAFASSTGSPLTAGKQ
jgi:hypothetical protein